jgi:DNA-binding response OmpR family regulator
VVVVDDDAAFLDVMTDLLREEGCRVLPCQHGEEAVEVIRRASPQLVVLDIRLAGEVSGEAILEALWNDPDRSQHPPILVCTADSAATMDLADRLRARGDDILAKPFEMNELLARVRALLWSGQVDNAAAPRQ